MTATASNYRQSELDKFAALASRWWDPDGPQKPLHALNPVRLAYVARRVPLAGARVLDVGCGGGLLSEALAAAGAHVTAIDLAPELVRVAQLHARESGLDIDYRQQAVESLHQVRGTLNLIAGDMARLDPQAIAVETPEGRVGVRGGQVLLKVKP